jgi:hypothetical protein
VSEAASGSKVTVVGAASCAPRVLVLAADPAWAARLAAQLRLAGADIETARSVEPLAGLLSSGDLAGAVVDVSALGYDGIAAVSAAAAAGIPVLAVIQRNDAALRRRAKGAGATWVATYRAMFQRGPRIGASWLGLPTPPAASSTPGDPQS